MGNSIVPFFDGIYISSPEPSFNKNLLSFIEEFNSLKKESTIKFEQKETEERVKEIVDADELSSFLVLQNWFSKNSSKFYVNAFLKHMDIIKKLMDGLNSIDINQEKREKELKKKNYKISSH